MSLDSLHRRIDTLLEQTRRAMPVAREPGESLFHMRLFTPAEQDRLQDVIDQVEPRVCYQGKTLDLRELSTEELDQLALWVYLQDALERENLDAAAKYRRWLAMPVEQLIAAFLAIDLRFLPTDANYSDGPLSNEHGHIYYFSKTKHRDIRINHIERGRISRDTIDQMRRWVDFFITSRDLSA